MHESRKNVPLRCSIFCIWRSGLTRGAGTKNINSTSPPPLLLCCCCCAAAAAVLLCCCCCAAASAAPRSAIHRCSTIRDADPRFIQRFPKKMFRFHVPFPSFGVLVCPVVLGPKTAASRCRSASRSSDVESRVGASCTKSIALPHQAFQHVKYLRVTRS